MSEFLFGGGGFQNIIRDFGRPPVRQWTPVACHAGAGRSETPNIATRRVSQVPRDPDLQGTGLSAWTRRAGDALRDLAGREGVHTAVLAVDPNSWEAVEFVLWDAAAPKDPGAERYEVLHVSAPEIDGIPEGIVWSAQARA
jgi:hypothetical protein